MEHTFKKTEICLVFFLSGVSDEAGASCSTHEQVAMIKSLI